MDYLHPIKKYILIVLGSLSLLLGCIGIFIPVLPTTPFLLLACFCYLKSSQKLYNWLIDQRVLGNYIYNYVTYKAITTNTKIVTICFLWLALCVSIVLIDIIYVDIFLILVGIAVSIHLLMLKTLKSSDLQEDDAPKTIQNIK